MDSSKWPLVFVCLSFKVIQTEASAWTVKVPSSVKGLPGSCVVIPCSFNYPDPGKKITQFTGIWTETEDQFIYHPHASKMREQYRNRTEMLGDVTHKNCSLKIDPLQQSDQGPFYFRIEMADYERFSYKDNSVSISMINKLNPISFSVKEEVVKGETVSASCSVSHSCPVSPPAFTWNHPGEKRFHPKQLEDGQWEATSTLTFHATNADHEKSLQCTVRYNERLQQNASKVLKVKHSPENVKIEYKSDVKEGEDVSLQCSSDAYPPASKYVWHSETGAELYEGQIYVLSNISRHKGVHLYCSASNALGQGNSNYGPINVLYAPEIKSASYCSSEADMVKCVCIVESRPPSIIHFVLSDRVLTSTNVEKHGSVNIATLQAELGSFDFVLCLANNTQGNASLKLSLTFNNSPENVKIEYKSDVKEGEDVSLQCSSDAYPPASKYVWHSETGAELYEGQIYVLSNISRHKGVHLYCSASNALGQGNSNYGAINVLYAPEIKSASYCSSEADMVKCVCIVESRPPSIIHFVLSDRVLTSTNVEKHGSVNIATLQAELGSFDFVLCLANNTQGNASLKLSLTFNSKLQNIVIIATGAGVILVIILTAVAFKKCRGRSGDAPSHMSTMKADKDVELPKKKESCDWSPDYANDHIYGNMESDCEEQTYANV